MSHIMSGKSIGTKTSPLSEVNECQEANPCQEAKQCQEANLLEAVNYLPIDAKTEWMQKARLDGIFKQVEDDNIDEKENNHIQDALECGICQYQLLDPYVSIECGHVFCSICLNQCFEKKMDLCPSGCGQRLESKDWKKASIPIQKMLDLTLVECSQCENEFQRCAIHEHVQQTCPKRKIVCPKNCGQSYCAQDEEEHVEECPNVRISCSDCTWNPCQSKCLRKNMEKHKKKCTTYNLALKNHQLEHKLTILSRRVVVQHFHQFAKLLIDGKERSTLDLTKPIPNVEKITIVMPATPKHFITGFSIGFKRESYKPLSFFCNGRETHQSTFPRFYGKITYKHFPVNRTSTTKFEWKLQSESGTFDVEEFSFFDVTDRYF